MDAPFAEAAAGLGFVLDERQIAAFERYRDLILEAADRFNLTALREGPEIERRHFLESLALGRVLIDAGVLHPDVAVRVIDIGSGAGIPGLPLKIALPALQMSLLESNEKRCRFLREVIAELGLEGVRVLEGRAETRVLDPGERESYDVAVAKAVAPLAILLEYALPFLRVAGVLAGPKGSAAPRELEESRGALDLLGGEILSHGPFTPPGGRPQTMVLVRKARPTPERFPRRPGLASKRPLA